MTTFIDDNYLKSLVNELRDKVGRQYLLIVYDLLQ